MTGLHWEFDPSDELNLADQGAPRGHYSHIREEFEELRKAALTLATVNKQGCIICDSTNTLTTQITEAPTKKGEAAKSWDQRSRITIVCQNCHNLLATRPYILRATTKRRSNCRYCGKSTHENSLLLDNCQLQLAIKHQWGHLEYDSSDYVHVD